MNEVKPTQTEELAKIDNHLAAINTQLRKQNSFKLSLMRGLMAGLGATVGVAIVLTSLVFIINFVANLVGQPSVGQSLIEVIQ